MSDSSNHLLWGLGCVLALVVGIIVGRMGLLGPANAPPAASNFQAQVPLTQIRGQTFKDQTVPLDGKEYIDCTFDNVVFAFEGKAGFQLTNVHFEKGSKFGISSDNPVVKATLQLMTVFVKLERGEVQPESGVKEAPQK
jgi:hypothetical protein